MNVARGYARNFLLPRRLAEPATPAKVAELRKRDEQRARHEARSVEQAQEMAEMLEKTVLRFEVKAGPTGSLFGSVTPTQIADELWRTRKIRVDRRKIEIDTIKRIGRYDVPIELFQDVRVEVKTLVVPEGGELPSEDELAAMEAEERGERGSGRGRAMRRASSKRCSRPKRRRDETSRRREPRPAAEAEPEAEAEPQPSRSPRPSRRRTRSRSQPRSAEAASRGRAADSPSPRSRPRPKSTA